MILKFRRDKEYGMKKTPGDLWRVGIDLGGTKTETIVLDPRGAVRIRGRRPTDQSGGYSTIVQTILAACRDGLDEIPPGEPAALGMGIPGMIDERTRKVVNANTTALIGHSLQADLEAALGRPIAVDNDANCFVLAESMWGAGREYGMVFGVILGTGCGGGIAIDGRIHRGPNGIAGEWGHFAASPGGRECWCGNRGCVETMLAGPSLAAACEAETGEQRDAAEIVEGFRRGEAACVRVFGQYLEDFGRCLGGVISTLDPDVVILGGGISCIDELYTLGAKAVRRYAFHRNLATPILKNELGDSAGVFGAAWIGVPA